jgi:transposase, IS605 OrfB family, central region
MTSMVKVFSFRIKDSICAKSLAQMARACNFVWNFANETQLHAVKWNKKWPTGYDLNNLTGGCAKDLGLDSQTVQAVCEEYATRRKQTKKFKLRWRGKRSFGWIPFKKSGIKLDGDAVIYCGHLFRFWKSREIEGDIRSGNFSQDARGRWYVNIACEVEPQPQCGNGEVGVDLGLKTLVTCSDGKKYDAQRHFRQLEDRLAYAQRNGKKRMAKSIHAKIKNSRKDFNHKVSHELTRGNRLIVVGDVGGRKMMRTKFAKSVSDAAWSQLRTFLSYKAIARKGVYVEVQSLHNPNLFCVQCTQRPLQGATHKVEKVSG